MASRYWVGGTATWDTTAGTKWAVTSGGAGGATVPTSADDVFFDAASGTVTVTTSGTTNMNARSVDFDGFTGTFNHVAGTTLRIGDSGLGQNNIALRLYPSMTLTIANATTSLINFVSTHSAAVHTITANGKTQGSLTFSGLGGRWQLQDQLRVSFATNSTITHTGGTLDTNNQIVGLGIYNNTGSNARTLTLGSSVLTFAVNTTPWSVALVTNFTFNANTSSLIFASGTITAPNGTTFYDVTLNGSGVLTNNYTFNNFTSTGTALKLGGTTMNVNGVLTITPSARYRMSGTPNQVTVTAATASLTNVTFSNIVGAGAASPFTGTALGDWGGNSNITFSPRNLYFVATPGTHNFNDATKWSLTSGGSTAGVGAPLPSDSCFIDGNSGLDGSSTITLNAITLCKDIDFTGSPSGLTITNSVNANAAADLNITGHISGSLTLGAGNVWTNNSNGFGFNGGANATLTTNGVTFGIINLNRLNTGTLSLGSDLLMHSTRLLLNYGGRFATAGYALTCAGTLGAASPWAGNFSGANSIVTFNGTGVLMSTQGLTMTQEWTNSTIYITDTSTTAKMFEPDQTANNRALIHNMVVSANNFMLYGATPWLVITGTLTLNIAGYAIGFKIAGGNKIRLAGDLVTNGSAGNLAIITTGGSPGVLYKYNGKIILDYVTINNTTIVGSAPFYAGANSVVGTGSLVGWSFRSGQGVGNVDAVMAFMSWG